MEYWLQLAVVGALSVLFVLVMHLWGIINKTFGYNMLKTLLKTKLLAQKGFLLLEIKHRSGAREYQTVKQSPVIFYTVNENNKPKKKVVFFDPKAIDYIQNIPVLSVSPNEVRPIDRDTGLVVNIPGEYIDKLAKDTALDYETDKNNNNIIKQVIWGIIGVGIVLILAVSYMYGNITDLNTQILVCERALAESATIIGG